VARVSGARRRRAQNNPSPRRAPILRLPWLIGGLALLLGVAALAWLVLRPSPGAQEGSAIATLQTLDQHALVFSPTDPNVVLFGHHNGVMRSEDGGRSWKPLVDRRGFDAMQLATAGSSAARLYLAGHDVFELSEDGGANWRPIQHNLPGTDIHQFTLNPDDPLELIAVVVGFGTYRSADGGRMWTKLPAQPAGDVTALASAGGSPETMYVGTARSGVLRSTNEGRSWIAVAGQTSDDTAFRTILALAVDPSARQRLFAGTESGLAKSEDGGMTWAALPYPGDNAVAVAVSPANPNVVLAIATSPRRQGLVYRSADGGRTWDGAS
jgi:photosystem II stability/assembly factor-like uncharacterized protein